MRVGTKRAAPSRRRHACRVGFLILALGQAAAWVRPVLQPISQGVGSMRSISQQRSSPLVLHAKKRWGGVRRKIEGGDEPEPAPVPAGKEEGEAAETGQQEKWTMEWIQSLSPEQVMELDKGRLMDVLMKDIGDDKEWARVPDEADFSDNEEYDAKEGFYDDELTKRVFGPGVLDVDEDDSDFEAFLEGEEEFEDGFDWSDDEEEAKGPVDVAKKAAELKALLKGMKDDDTEEMDEDEEMDEWLKMLQDGDGEDEEENEEGEEDSEWEEEEEELGSGSKQPRRLPGGVVEDPQLKRLLDTEGSKADSAAMTMAIQSCVARGDMETAAELMKRMEELGLEVGDLDDADSLDSYKMPLSQAIRGSPASRKFGDDSDSSDFGEEADFSDSEDEGEEGVPSISAEEAAALQAQGACVGIDLGTTHSAVAVLQEGRVLLLPSSESGNTIVPSVVQYTKDGKVVVGEAAKKVLVTDAESTFGSIKRLMGKTTVEEVMKEEEGSRRRAVSLLQKEGSIALFVGSTKQELSPEQVSSEILRSLIKDAEAYLKTPVNRAVITVPAYFTPEQCDATERAGKLAGLKRVKLLREPEAAALAYGLDKREDELVMVFDLGGGTLDVSILEVGGGIVEVLATFGDAQLGGDDFDRRIAEWTAAQFEKANGMKLPADRAINRLLLDAARRAREELSLSPETKIKLSNLHSNKGVDVVLTRRVMEAQCEDLFTRMTRPMRQAALMAGVALEGEMSPQSVADLPERELTEVEFEGMVGQDLISSLKAKALEGRQLSKAKAQYRRGFSEVRKQNPGVKMRQFPNGRRLSEVVLVGGGTRMPSVRKLVETVTGLLPRTTVNPDEAVALGAGIHAGMLDGVIGDMEMMTPMQAALLRGMADYERRKRRGGGQVKKPR